ncbi:hypothetical protein HKCCE3408_12485 [Rhodobacterales bacterium HKCCE3408]|nr:hypothetical protein [Rhodobacterales bacterium HKCCE3408]
MSKTLSRWPLVIVLSVQLASAGFFLFDLWGEVLGLRSRPLPFVVGELAQVAASVALLTGIIVTVIFMRRSQAVINRLDQQIGAVSGNFDAQLNRLFNDWRLSQSEAEITIYAIKGFSNAEIGDLRGTSATTVKSQMNAIYRKTGFANRQQLIAFMVEELLHGAGSALREEPMDTAA